jgi:hypothetical protein
MFRLNKAFDGMADDPREGDTALLGDLLKISLLSARQAGRHPCGIRAILPHAAPAPAAFRSIPRHLRPALLLKLEQNATPCCYLAPADPNTAAANISHYDHSIARG